jgi:hypothetical protein
VSIIRSSNGPSFKKRRSWKSRLLELSLWVAIAIATAVILVMLSEQLLPSNF